MSIEPDRVPPPPPQPPLPTTPTTPAAPIAVLTTLSANPKCPAASVMLFADQRKERELIDLASVSDVEITNDAVVS